MTNHIKNLFTRFKSCDEGATLVEYGIALSIAVAVGAGAFVTLGDNVAVNAENANAAVKGETGTAVYK